MRAKNKGVCGIGINDADYATQIKESSGTLWCQFYLRWSNMLRRCYSGKIHSRAPSYIDCTVCDEWLTFSNFKRWMETQEWLGKELDKDLLSQGNKIYSPETCVFVDLNVNHFILDRSAKRGDFPIGVSFDKVRGKFQSYCGNPFTGKSSNLGYFDCPEKAHEAWRKRKHELACQLADLQTNERVANALRSRYLGGQN